MFQPLNFKRVPFFWGCNPPPGVVCSMKPKGAHPFSELEHQSSQPVPRLRSPNSLGSFWDAPFPGALDGPYLVGPGAGLLGPATRSACPSQPLGRRRRVESRVVNPSLVQPMGLRPRGTSPRISLGLRPLLDLFGWFLGLS